MLYYSLEQLVSYFHVWQFELQGLMVSSRNADALTYSLWSLLPSFCNYPLDTAKSFMDLEKTLCITLQEEPDIRGIICTSLQLLIQQNKRIVDEKDDKECVGGDMACEHGLAHYTKQVAASNLNVLKSSAQELLTVLSHVFLKSTKDDGGCLQVFKLNKLRMVLLMIYCQTNILAFLIYEYSKIFGINVGFYFCAYLCLVLVACMCYLHP